MVGSGKRRGTIIAVIMLLLVVSGLYYFFSTERLQEAQAAVSYGNPNMPAAQTAIKKLREKSHEYPGLSMAAGKGSKILFVGTAGYSNLEKRLKVQPSSKFRIYSVSKPITATALLQLYEKGLIELDAPVNRYLRDLPSAFSGVSVRQLAGHLSGVRDYKRGEWLKLSSIHCNTVQEALDAFIQDALEKQAGQFQYSTFNYVILSRLIEVVSQTPFTEYINEFIFLPAAMKHTTLNPDRIETQFYEEALLGRVKQARTVDNSCKWGAGAWHSTSADLVQFALALLNEKLISRKTLDLMFTSMNDANGKPTNYGFGWWISHDKNNQLIGSHSGGAFGGRAALVVFPSQKVAVSILASLEGARLTSLAQEVAESLALSEPEIYR